MRTLSAIVVALGLLGATAAGADGEERSVPSFASLQDAVNFLVSCVDTQDHDALSAASLRAANVDARLLLAALKARHERTPLTQLYAGREFPQDANHLKLGGHDRELGHVHVDFVKKGKAWYLDGVWMCR